MDLLCHNGYVGSMWIWPPPPVSDLSLIKQDTGPAAAGICISRGQLNVTPPIFGTEGIFSVVVFKFQQWPSPCNLHINEIRGNARARELFAHLL